MSTSGLWHFDVNARQTRIRTMSVGDVNENKNIVPVTWGLNLRASLSIAIAFEAR